ncbi:MAG: hypothetical protein JST62_11140 [Bacteroidetes bacterium]|nr:hypothetical protein [Bacteroidota bacterium]
MKKLILGLTATVMFSMNIYANSNKSSDISNVIDNKSITEKITLTDPQTIYTYTLKTSCGTFITTSTKCYSESELKTIFVGIEQQYCNKTVSIQSVSVTEV